MLSAAFFDAHADEGMWLPSLISQRIEDMQAKGFRLTAEDIYSINSASLKDAVVLFGRGCTGELISDEGLLLTNHHCGYSQIQKHSSVEHDYLRDGFWAMTRDEELPNEGLTVSFLERMEDVTDAVLQGYSPEMTETQRDSVIKANSGKLVEKATAEGNGLRATVEALYYGNQYFLFLYREYSDVRLVGAPPSSVGKFGGDTDNWMWPRHTGDFSIFRIYADKDNNPAPYSEDNVPYRPKRHFRISLGGVEEGDFTFVYGFPGRTQEYLMSEGVRYISEVSDPHRIALRTMRLDIQKKYMDAGQAVRIQYSSKNAGVANSWKKWQGEVKGIRKMGTVGKKQEYEKAFMEWARGTEYEGVVERLDSLYGLLEPYSYATDYYGETAYSIELVRFALGYNKKLTESMLSSSTDRIAELRKEMKKMAADFYKDYFIPIDRESFVAVMEAFDRNVTDDFKPEYFKESLTRYGTMEAWADSLWNSSVFADSLKLKEATDSLRLLSLSEGSDVVSDIITLRGGKTRNTVRAYINGPHANMSLNGLAVCDKSQCCDNTTYIEHASGGSSSNQLFKYILDGSSRGNFYGLVKVDEGAQKTSALQTNRNLCLSPDAVMRTLPQLEIYADDVKCNHGATIGQMDEAALFYLRSRGISSQEARMLLMFAFVKDVLDNIRIPVLRERLEMLIEKRLRGKESDCSACGAGCHSNRLY